MGQANFVSSLDMLRRPSTRSVLPGRHRSERRLRNALLKWPILILLLSLCGAVFILQNALSAVGMRDDGLLIPLLSRTGLSGNTEPAKPIFVVAGGAPRTGSTFIYNVLRVLMRIRDPNTVASSNWMLQKLVPENINTTHYDRVALLRTMGTSVLVKVHTAHQYYVFAGPANKRRFAEDVDLLYTSFRDLREETVSAFKMFAHNRTAFESDTKWAELCRSLIRRRDSLIIEAGSTVPIVDVQYEDWKDGSDAALMRLIRRLGEKLPWKYSESDYRRTLREVQRLRVPLGGEPEARVDWHLANLMSPRHISLEKLSENFIEKGIRAVEREPVCNDWLRKKKYLL